VGVAGVLILSMPPEQKGFSLRAMGSRAMVLGLAAGTLFAVSAVSYRGASLQVDSGDPLLRAAVTLAAVVILQTCVMALWLPLREAGQIARVWQARRVAVWIGLTSMAGSLCWFIAFTLQTAAYVKAVGQVELIFGVAASVLFFREKIGLREAVGITVLTLSILLLVLAA